MGLRFPVKSKCTYISLWNCALNSVNNLRDNPNSVLNSTAPFVLVPIRRRQQKEAVKRLQLDPDRDGSRAAAIVLSMTSSNSSDRGTPSRRPS
jgi:hypothetical protein